VVCNHFKSQQIHPMHIAPIFSGPALIALGLAIRYKIAKRKFLRRSMTGLEYFPSYGAAIVTRFVEGLARLVAFVMIVVGIVLLLSAAL
jgi:hypothetical protein